MGDFWGFYFRLPQNPSDKPARNIWCDAIDALRKEKDRVSPSMSYEAQLRLFQAMEEILDKQRMTVYCTKKDDNQIILQWCDRLQILMRTNIVGYNLRQAILQAVRDLIEEIQRIIRKRGRF